jgi:formylglycine-generating enzyme required for sulfatase activity
MAGKIFINYRRADDPGFAQALFGRLEQAFPSERLFMDVDSKELEPGLDFVHVLQEQVAECDVLVSVIGKAWLDARDATGARRLDNPDDFVRIEIESALKQDKRVIPVLVGEAQMPRADELPEAMKPLARRHAVRLTHERFRADSQGLITALQRALEKAEDLRNAQAAAAREAEAEERRKEEEAEVRRRAEADARRKATEAEAARRAEEERRRREAERQRGSAQAAAEPSGMQGRRGEPREAGSPPWRARLLGGGAAGAIAAGVALAWVLQPAPRPPGEQPAVVAQRPIAVQPVTQPPAPAPQPPASAPQPPVAAAPQAPVANAATAVPLSPGRERALKPGDTFSECANCPQMVVVPSGSFTMGSPANEPGRDADEGPQHKVTIAKAFAVSAFELTFDAWDACVADGGCGGYKPPDSSWGRGRQPAINVSWDDAKAYVAWLSKKTGKLYRLLTEAEYEYATRAGTQTAYPWGNDIGKGNADCNGCGSRSDNKQAAPVGSFAANPFGLYDMVGNVWEWAEDCYHDSYNGAPTDGSAWTAGDCSRRVVRGGSWFVYPLILRSALRDWYATVDRVNYLGFRVARTLLTP